MFKITEQVAGLPPIESVTPVPGVGATVSPTPGFLVKAEDPVWGPGEFVFGRANGAIRIGGLAVLTPVWDAVNFTYTQNFTEAASTAGQGRSVYVYVGSTALTTGQFGWFMTSGTYPVNSSAAVAAGVAIGVAAAGQGGANSAGKQIVNALVVGSATQTVITSGSGVQGDNIIKVTNTAGFFPGAYVSGTGVGAAAIVASVDQNGKSITVTVANALAVTGNITATYNNGVIFYNVVQLNRGFLQGAIT
jgi:hypothetical protein